MGRDGMTNTSTKIAPAISEAELQELLEEIAIRTAELEDAKKEIVTLKRELATWQGRAERAETAAMKWKMTADEWRHECMKKSGRR